MSNNFKIRKASSLEFLDSHKEHPANTYFHFPMASYHNPKNVNFGVLRVLNDDTIEPYDGFDRHPHIDVEIVSYVVSGELTHKDSSTRKTNVLTTGHVQTMTAGTGVYHSELNEHDGETRVIQVWFHPNRSDHKTRYNLKKYNPKDRQNKLLHIVGNPSNKRNVGLHVEQDINIFVCEFTKGNTTISFSLKEGRQAYITNLDGELDIKGFEKLGERDGIEIMGPATLEFKASTTHAHFMVVEMFKPKGR